MLLSRGALDHLGAELSFAQSTCRFANVPTQPLLQMVNVRGHLGLRLWLHPHSLVPVAQSDATILQRTQRSTALISMRYKDLPVLLPAENLDVDAVAIILSTSLPHCAQRTNLQQDASTPTHGLVLGGFTQRGHGITQATAKRSQLLDAVHVVSRSRPPMLRM
eukprot:2787679-Amphidinium_carterae.1